MAPWRIYMFYLISSYCIEFWHFFFFSEEVYCNFSLKGFFASQNFRPIVSRLWYSNQQINWISLLWVKVNQIWLWKRRERALRLSGISNVTAVWPGIQNSLQIANPTFQVFWFFCESDILGIQELFKWREKEYQISLQYGSCLPL